MKIKGIIEEDMVNFKKPSMVIMMPSCDWKCGKEICQNSPLALSPNIEVSPQTLVQRYLKNDISQALVFAGLEPFLHFEEMIEVIAELRRYGNSDPVIIYTGYNENEVIEQIKILQQYSNIIIKFGRFIVNSIAQFDNILGVFLASNNQFAKIIS